MALATLNDNGREDEPRIIGKQFIVPYLALELGGVGAHG